MGATSGRGEAVGVIDGSGVADGVWDGLVVGVAVLVAVGVVTFVTEGGTFAALQEPSRRSAPRRATGSRELANGPRVAIAALLEAPPSAA